MTTENSNKDGKKNKGFWGQLSEKLDKYLEAKSKKTSCCQPRDDGKGGKSSCC